MGDSGFNPSSRLVRSIKESECYFQIWPYGQPVEELTQIDVLQYLMCSSNSKTCCNQVDSVANLQG